MQVLDTKKIAGAVAFALIFQLAGYSAAVMTQKKVSHETAICQERFGTGHGTIITEEFIKRQYKKTKDNRVLIHCKEEK